MGFTNKALFSVLLLSNTLQAQTHFFSGLATRDQNPILLGFWQPHTLPARIQKKELYSQVSISNTMHQETTDKEQLFIDAESYRLDFNLAYPLKTGLLHLQIPFISHQAGGLDSLIYKFHDFFSMPQGYRNLHQQNQYQLSYTKDSNNIIHSSQSVSGLGDISLSYSFPIMESTHSYLSANTGINLPTGSDLLSNKQIDLAVWVSYFINTKSQSAYFITLGAVKNGQGGGFSDLIVSNSTFVQTGLKWPLIKNIALMLQADYRSSFLQQTDVRILGKSLQLQTGLEIPLSKENVLNLFFSEDILVGSAPDITFAASLKQQF